MLTHKNEEQQAEPGNSLAPLTRFPLPFPRSFFQPRGQPLSLHLTCISIFISHSPSSRVTAALCSLLWLWKEYKTWSLSTSFVCKPGLSTSFSSRNSYCVHLAAPTHTPSQPSPSSCFLNGIPESRLSQWRSMGQPALYTEEM